MAIRWKCANNGYPFQYNEGGVSAPSLFFFQITVFYLFYSFYKLRVLVFELKEEREQSTRNNEGQPEPGGTSRKSKTLLRRRRGFMELVLI